ncbi:type II secretion system protein [Ezakiella peruensis]|uniref:type II secretion system protein n=1 Tax=Ezakiella peruensis TaxID=1464038 RepID=UPI00147301B1|nr:prepilin-type N-terminal cleavage/methylation domain-containing protein [Ezakiella peruensis]
MKYVFQSKKNKAAFTLLEVIISIVFISLLMTGLIFFKDVLTNSKAEENNKNYFDLFDASYFIANQIKIANTYSIVEIKDRFNSIDKQYVFESYPFEDKEKDIKKEIAKKKKVNYYYFENDNGNLKYRAYNTPIRGKLVYNAFSDNIIIKNIDTFDLSYNDGIFEIYIKDKFGNESRRKVLSGVYNE